jgi:hypothetical protein
MYTIVAAVSDRCSACKNATGWLPTTDALCSGALHATAAMDNRQTRRDGEVIDLSGIIDSTAMYGDPDHRILSMSVCFAAFRTSTIACHAHRAGRAAHHSLIAAPWRYSHSHRAFFLSRTSPLTHLSDTSEQRRRAGRAVHLITAHSVRLSADLSMHTDTIYTEGYGKV